MRISSSGTPSAPWSNTPRAHATHTGVGGGRVGSQGVGGHEMVRWQLVSPDIPFGVGKIPYSLFLKEISRPGKSGTQL